MKSKKRKLTKQARQLLMHILVYDKVTTTYCRDDLSIMHPSGRIKELRDHGWPIGTSIFEQIDASGKAHKAGQYYLQDFKLTTDQRLFKLRVGMMHQI